ncbi:protein of unknown function [Natrinema hispanicum]|uniref:DUF4177 domain-containing protein n=2 Tax=Natrinema hispanicum TaxID=392421 RepID=A0A1I0BJ85_9EURY|nr:protein of unknown function [Natrinema hispanicum]SET07054.1 protein of unknown function [Natrinema hispanicum]
MSGGAGWCQYSAVNSSVGICLAPVLLALTTSGKAVMSHSDMRRWEYKTLRPPRDETKKEAEDPQDELNAYGDDGWELVETIDYTNGGTKFLVFKRPAGVTGSATEE